jgi:hypothetical protein
VLVGQLKRKVGRTILGRFAQGAKQPGKTAPWQIDPASEAETAQALKVMNELSRPEAVSANAGPAGSSGPAVTELGDTPPWAKGAPPF